MTSRRFRAGVSIAALLACSATGQAFAQEKPAAQAETYGDIIVTAQRRSESLQKAPAAITAITNEEIAAQRIEGVLDLQRATPSLTISESFGGTQMSLRGLGNEFSSGTAFDAAVLTYVDGVYLARPNSVGSAYSDLERIEVLRGPQGTLYGRNATGGVVSLYTRTPGDDFGADISLTYGRYNRFQLSGGIEGPLTSNVSARIAFLHDQHDGDQINLFTGERARSPKTNAIRGVVVAEPGEATRITVRGDYYKNKIKGFNFDLVGVFPNGLGVTSLAPGGILQGSLNLRPTLPLPHDGKRVAFDYADPFISHKSYGGSVTLEQDIFGGDAQLKSISAYRYAEFNRRQDYDGSSAAIFNAVEARETSKQISQELNIGGRTDGGADWIFGAYYFRERTTEFYSNELPSTGAILSALLGTTIIPTVIVPLSRRETNSFSLYGQATVPITEQLKLTAGIRKNFDTRNVQGNTTSVFGSASVPILSKGSDNPLTWKFGLQYDLSRDNMLYASVTSGFKSGGNSTSTEAAFEPEEIISYEIGSRNTFLDGRLQLNATGFYYDYTNLQVTTYLGTVTLTENAPGARVYGLELEARVRPMARLELGGSLAKLHTEYRGYKTQNQLIPTSPVLDLTGFAFPHAAGFTASGFITYTIPIGDGGLNLRYDLNHSSKWYGDAPHTPEATQPAYTTHNLRASYQFGDFEVGAYVDNLTNKAYRSGSFSVGAFSGIATTWAPLRTWGLFVKAKI